MSRQGGVGVGAEEYSSLGLTSDLEANERIIEDARAAREAQAASTTPRTGESKSWDVENGQPGGGSKLDPLPEEDGHAHEDQGEHTPVGGHEEAEKRHSKKGQYPSSTTPESTPEHEFPGTEQPKNNIFVVMGALGLISFISALDQSILATALPTIAGELNASHSEYSWIGTSYLLGQTLLTPLNGRLSDITGRKPMLYGAIGFMLVFSALSGAAKNVTWLIIARFFTGLGGGSIVSLSIIIISDVVPMNKRAKYQGYLGAAFGIASVVGPILGGVLTSKTTWRWCFYINLPTCGLALVLLIFFLKLNRPQGQDLVTLRKSFDFVGLLAVMTAAALLIVGFSTAADDGFGAPAAYGVIIGGVVVFIGAIVHCLTTKKNAVLPKRYLTTRTTVFFSMGSFLNSLLLLSITFLLPQFFQGVRGFSPLRAGEAVIPFSVIVSTFVILSGEITTRFGIARPVVWAGFTMTCLGYGLFYRILRADVSYGAQEAVQVIPGIGQGLALQSPMMIIQAAMPAKDMAASMSAWILLRSIAAAVGLAIFTALLNSEMRTRFEGIPGYGTVFDVPRSGADYKKLHELSEPLRSQVIDEFSKSFGLCWIVGTALIGAALFITLWTKNYKFDQNKGEPVPSTTTANLGLKSRSQHTSTSASSTVGDHVPGTPFSEKTLVHLDPTQSRSEIDNTAPTPVDLELPQTTQAQTSGQGGPRRRLSAYRRDGQAPAAGSQPFEMLERARSIPGEEGIIPLARHGSHVR